jgi:hypothetical protein
MGRSGAGALLGVWLGLLLASWTAASLNFRAVDRVLGPDLRPEADQRFGGVAPSDRRVLLRHAASEANRGLFAALGLMQAVVAALALALAWPAGGGARHLSLAAAVVFALQALLLVGPIVELGRAIDFVPRPLPADVGRRFGLLHAAYVGSDLLKAALLAAAAALLARRP